MRTHCKKSFKKIRIRKNKKKPVKKAIAVLIDKRNKILHEDSEENLKEIDEKIAECEALEIRNEIMKNFKSFSENPESISMQKMWKLLKKISPKLSPTLPSAKHNHKGKIVSGSKEIKDLLANEYKNRLRSRPTRPDLKNMKSMKKKIFNMKMKLAKGKRSSSWEMVDLEKVLTNLKSGKSRDPRGISREIFHI